MTALGNIPLTTEVPVYGSGAVWDPAPAISGFWFRHSFVVNAVAVTSALGAMSATRIALSAGTLDRIAVSHFGNATASELLRLGIYNDSNLRPGTRLLDAGTIDLSTVAGFKSITISQAVTTGYYWLAAVRQGPTNTATMAAYAAQAQQSVRNGWTEATGTSVYDPARTVATIGSISGALPTPFGAATMTGFSGSEPIVAVRYA